MGPRKTSDEARKKGHSEIASKLFGIENFERPFRRKIFCASFISSKIYETNWKYEYQNITFQISENYGQLFQLNFSKFRTVLSRIGLIQSQEELMPLSRTKAIRYELKTLQN